MKRLGAIALAVGVLTASCAGHGGSPLPQGPGATQGQTTHSNLGTGTTRPASIAAIPSGWAATGTQALTLRNATDLGALDSTKVLTVRIGLQMRNAQQAQSLVQQRATLTPDQVTAQFGPTADQVSAVTSYLQTQGFTNIAVEPNNMLVSADATVAQIQKAFNTQLDSFSQNGITVFANTTAALVPATLGNIVTAVLGLNDMKMKPAPITKCWPASMVGSVSSPVATPCLRDFNAPSFWAAYDAGSTPTGKNTTVAVMAEGDLSQVIPDLRTAEAKDGLPQVPASIVHVGLASPDTSGLDEWDLDTQSSTGIANGVSHLYIYDTTSLTDSDVAFEYNHWVHDNLAKLGNSSFGECEAFPYLDGAMLVDDQLFLMAAVQGQTMFVSSGDTGSACPVAVNTGVGGTGVPGVSYPASSPYVVAVGGTTLVTNPDGTYLGEAAWNGGGGGLSAFEYQPFWEVGTQPASTSTTAGLGVARGIPDIAMDADPNTGADVYVNGSLLIVGGTSLASPLAMGVYSRLQTAHGNALGFGPIAFYGIYQNYPSPTQFSGGPPPTQLRGGYHDILSGDNGAFTALPGYDYTTGMGSFDITKANETIR